MTIVFIAFIKIHQIVNFFSQLLWKNERCNEKENQIFCEKKIVLAYNHCFKIQNNETKMQKYDKVLKTKLQLIVTLF